MLLFNAQMDRIEMPMHSAGPAWALYSPMSEFDQACLRFRPKGGECERTPPCEHMRSAGRSLYKTTLLQITKRYMADAPQGLSGWVQSCRCIVSIPGSASIRIKKNGSGMAWQPFNWAILDWTQLQGSYGP